MSPKIISLISTVVLLASASFAEDGKGKVPKTIKSKTVTFESTTVSSYIDNPQLVSIAVANKQDDLPISFNRSFKDMLSVNIDKETAARINGKGE